MRFLAFVFWILLFYLLYKIIIKNVKIFGFRKSRETREIIQDELVKDPYCMTYIPRKNAIRMHIKNEEHFFCSKECLSKYSEKVRKAS